MLPVISARYPQDLREGKMRFVEPFVGGGAVMVDVLATYCPESALIADSNRSLTNLYTQVRDSLDALSDQLAQLSSEYLPLEMDPSRTDSRAAYYYDRRAEYNSIAVGDDARSDIRRAALFIFLNRTCFNGLYRVNPRGEFNVPTGRYKNPLILDYGNLARMSEVLQGVDIKCANYSDTLAGEGAGSFVYLDPPYRPLSATSSFTGYAAAGFNDADQRALAESIRLLDARGGKFLLSNSDPKAADPDDDFFDQLYDGYIIERVEAKRSISAGSAGRVKLTEILVRNYE